MDLFSMNNFYLDYFCGGYTACGEDWFSCNQTCPYSKFYYIREGECELVIQGQKYHAEPGMLFLIPAGVIHSFYHISERFVTKYWFHFALECGGVSLFDRIACQFCVSIGNSLAVTALFEQILSPAAPGTDVIHNLRMKSAVLELVSQYFEFSGCRPVAAPVSESEQMSLLNRYIHNNLSRNITLQELADTVHLHPNYLVRFCKNKTGLPPMKYIARIKLEKAKQLLEHTDTPINEIVAELGFADAGHFYKRFKQFTTYSPSEFRATFRRNKS